MDGRPRHARHGVQPGRTGAVAPNKAALASIAKRHGVHPLQIALAWVLRREDVIAIPKAAAIDHVEQNHQALDIALWRKIWPNWMPPFRR